MRRATTAQRVTSPHEVEGKAGQCNSMLRPYKRSATWGYNTFKSEIWWDLWRNGGNKGEAKESVVVMVLVWVGGLVRSRTCLRGIVVNEEGGYMVGG